VLCYLHPRVLHSFRQRAAVFQVQQAERGKIDCATTYHYVICSSSISRSNDKQIKQGRANALPTHSVHHQYTMLLYE
jgi:hypothetical protein